MGDDGIQELTEMVEQAFPAPQTEPISEVATEEGKKAEAMEEQEGVADADEEPMETT